jgi:hypothetical protein
MQVETKPLLCAALGSITDAVCTSLARAQWLRIASKLKLTFSKLRRIIAPGSQRLCDARLKIEFEAPAVR